MLTSYFQAELAQVLEEVGARGCGFEDRAGAYARTEGAISPSPRYLFVSEMAVGLSVELRTNFDTCGVGFEGATGQLSGIWLGLWESASGGAAQSASIFIYFNHST